MRIAPHAPQFGHLYQLVPYYHPVSKFSTGQLYFNEKQTQLLKDAGNILGDVLTRKGAEPIHLPPDMIMTLDFLNNQKRILSNYVENILRKFPLPEDRMRPPLDKKRKSLRNATNLTLDNFFDLQSKAYPVYIRDIGLGNVEFTVNPTHTIGDKTQNAPDELYRALGQLNRYHD